MTIQRRRLRLPKKTFRGGHLPDVMETHKKWAWQIWTDSYKLSHTLMYSPKATRMVAYGEPRGALKAFNVKYTDGCPNWTYQFYAK